MGVIAKYKFNNTLEANLLPEFNSEFTSDLYTVTDEVNGEVTTRTIESDSLPTLMRFGSNLDTYVEGSELALLEILEMNTGGLTSCYRMFRRCSNLTKIECEWSITKVTNMSGMFQNCSNLTSLDVSDFDTTNMTRMDYMFYGCSSLTSLDVSGFDTGNVTNMGNMFRNCNSLTSLDVSGFDTSKVTEMSYMFRGCNNLTTLDVSNFNTNKVTSMTYMFRGCNNLTSLDLSGFDTSNVTNIGAMFYDCNNLTSLDLSGFDTSKVTSMNAIFYNCNKLTTLDISNFDTSKVTDFTNILTSTSSLQYIKCNNVSTLNTLNTLLPTKSSASQGTIICKSDITNLDTATLQSKYWNILDESTLIAKYVFDKSIYNNYIPEFNTEFEGYFIEDEVVEGNNEVIRTIEGCGMLPTLMRFGSNLDTYVEGSEVALLEILGMNTSGLTSCHRMFRFCKKLTSIICEWNTSNVISMKYMFQNCNNLTTLDVSNFDTSNVTNMSYMFYYCTNLTSLDVSNWNTSNVTDMSYMFQGCTNLTSLDVSNFNTSNVTRINHIFNNCYKLTTLDVSNWNTSNVTSTTNMFNNTPLLTDISVLYMDKSSLQKLVDAIPTDSNKTLWYKDVNIDGITHGDNITLKKYMEENVEIVLNSPLLEGDTIEVKDGKMCHVHRWEKVVLDGSEGWKLDFVKNNTITIYDSTFMNIAKPATVVFCNKFPYVETLFSAYDSEAVKVGSIGLYININKSKLSTLDSDGFKQWLQANPTTIIYELAEPYYEDITNLQSAPTLKTYLECSMEIDTDLPIDTNVTYRTNLSSVYVMERELDELDNGTDLGDILEGEVNE